MVPLSFRTSLLALVALPWIVTSPATVVAPALIVPVVAIVVEPPTCEAPLMVAAVIVLFVKVSVVARKRYVVGIGDQTGGHASASSSQRDTQRVRVPGLPCHYEVAALTYMRWDATTQPSATHRLLCK